MKKAILKTLLLIAIISAICVGAYFLLKAFELDDLETLREIVNKGWWGAVIYVLLQIIQVIFIPINTTIFTAPAIVLFGATKAFIISWIGCTLGSIIMFLVARYGGGRLLKWIVGEEKSKKYVEVLAKGKYLLPILLLIPIFPDDIMCASAGIGKINIVYFCIVITITRCIDTACTCFIGAELIKSPIG
ncbi:MAG: VTT domain-containing protein, partial [Lachnospiraceae bacterium]|nr:VTT domain-containing protein [Lachnospiraceae bacterium]